MQERSRRDLWLFGALCLGALLVFLPTLDAFFVSDDFFLIKAASGPRPFDLLTFNAQFFRPAAALSFFVDARLWGLSPVAFHVTSVLLHASSSFALFKIGERLELPRSVSLATAGLFLVAPAHSEPVAWISCRMDLIATAAGLFAIASWIGALRGVKGSRVVALLLLSLALLAKESAAPLCLVFVLLALRFSTRRRTDVVLPLCVLAIYLVVRRYCLGRWVGGYAPSDDTHSMLRSASHVALFTVRALTGRFPGEWIALDHPLYGVVNDATLRSWPIRMIGAALLAACVVAMAWLWRRRHAFASPLALVGIMYVATLLPVLHLDVSTVTVEGERFLYLPSALLLLLVVLLVSRLVTPRVARVIAAAVFVFYVGALEHSLYAWRQAGTLSSTLLGQIATAASNEPITIVNLPDDIRGAYVFRNGLADALTLFHPQARPVSVAVLHSVLSPDEAPRVSCAPRSIVVTMGDPRSFVTGVAAPASMKITGDPVGANIVELDGDAPAHWWAYRAGALAAGACD